MVILFDKVKEKNAQIDVIFKYIDYANQNLITSFEKASDIAKSVGMGKDAQLSLQELIKDRKKDAETVPDVVKDHKLAEKIVDFIYSYRKTVKVIRKMKLKGFFLRLLRGTIIIAFAYGFLSLCNWNLNAGDWNGFSRVLLGIVGVVSLLIIIGDNIPVEQD